MTDPAIQAAWDMGHEYGQRSLAVTIRDVLDRAVFHRDDEAESPKPDGPRLRLVTDTPGDHR